MQICKTKRRFAKRNANLENEAQICKMKCKSGKRSADLQNEMQIWKTECRFAKRNANLENGAQICKTKCKSAKRNPLWSTEFRRFDCHVCLYFLQLSCIAAVQPGELVLERELDAADVAVVGVVDLRGDTANWGRSVANHSDQKPGLRIEIQGCEEPSRAGSLDDKIV